jgi:hypothetical protein
MFCDDLIITQGSVLTAEGPDMATKSEARFPSILFIREYSAVLPSIAFRS